MTSYTITLSSDEHSQVIMALRSDAWHRRSLASGCGDIESLAKQKAHFQAEADRLDELATRFSFLDPLDSHPDGEIR